jgi:hypothetical protein
MSDETPHGDVFANISFTTEYLDALASARSPSHPRLRCDECGASRDGNLYVEGLTHALCPRLKRGVFRRGSNE